MRNTTASTLPLKTIRYSWPLIVFDRLNDLPLLSAQDLRDSEYLDQVDDANSVVAVMVAVKEDSAVVWLVIEEQRVIVSAYRPPLGQRITYAANDIASGKSGVSTMPLYMSSEVLPSSRLDTLRCALLLLAASRE